MEIMNDNLENPSFCCIRKPFENKPLPNKLVMMEFLIGYFILAELFKVLISGNLKSIFVFSLNGIVGVGLAIACGYFVGWMSRRNEVAR
jgi:hypothetical protein